MAFNKKLEAVFHTIYNTKDLYHINSSISILQHHPAILALEQFLDEFGIDQLNYQDESSILADGQTLLMHACGCRNIPAVQWLLEHNVDVELVSLSSFTTALTQVCQQLSNIDLRSISNNRIDMKTEALLTIMRLLLLHNATPYIFRYIDSTPTPIACILTTPYPFCQLHVDITTTLLYAGKQHLEYDLRQYLWKYYCAFYRPSSPSSMEVGLVSPPDTADMSRRGDINQTDMSDQRMIDGGAETQLLGVVNTPMEENQPSSLSLTSKWEHADRSNLLVFGNETRDDDDGVDDSSQYIPTHLPPTDMGHYHFTHPKNTGKCTLEGSSPVPCTRLLCTTISPQWIRNRLRLYYKQPLAERFDIPYLTLLFTCTHHFKVEDSNPLFYQRITSTVSTMDVAMWLSKTHESIRTNWQHYPPIDRQQHQQHHHYSGHTHPHQMQTPTSPYPPSFLSPGAPLSLASPGPPLSLTDMMEMRDTNDDVATTPAHVLAIAMNTLHDDYFQPDIPMGVPHNGVEGPASTNHPLQASSSISSCSSSSSLLASSIPTSGTSMDDPQSHESRTSFCSQHSQQDIAYYFPIVVPFPLVEIQHINPLCYTSITRDYSSMDSSMTHHRTPQPGGYRRSARLHLHEHSVDEIAPPLAIIPSPQAYRSTSPLGQFYVCVPTPSATAFSQALFYYQWGQDPDRLFNADSPAHAEPRGQDNGGDAHPGIDRQPNYSLRLGRNQTQIHDITNTTITTSARHDAMNAVDDSPLPSLSPTTSSPSQTPPSDPSPAQCYLDIMKLFYCHSTLTELGMRPDYPISAVLPTINSSCLLHHVISTFHIIDRVYASHILIYIRSSQVITFETIKICEVLMQKIMSQSTSPPVKVDICFDFLNTFTHEQSLYLIFILERYLPRILPSSPGPTQHASLLPGSSAVPPSSGGVPLRAGNHAPPYQRGAAVSVFSDRIIADALATDSLPNSVSLHVLNHYIRRSFYQHFFLYVYDHHRAVLHQSYAAATPSSPHVASMNTTNTNPSSRTLVYSHQGQASTFRQSKSQYSYTNPPTTAYLHSSFFQHQPPPQYASRSSHTRLESGELGHSTSTASSHSSLTAPRLSCQQHPMDLSSIPAVMYPLLCVHAPVVLDESFYETQPLPLLDEVSLFSHDVDQLSALQAFLRLYSIFNHHQRVVVYKSQPNTVLKNSLLYYPTRIAPAEPFIQGMEFIVTSIMRNMIQLTKHALRQCLMILDEVYNQYIVTGYGYTRTQPNSPFISPLATPQGGLQSLSFASISTSPAAALGSSSTSRSTVFCAMHTQQHPIEALEDLKKVSLSSLSLTSLTTYYNIIHCHPGVLHTISSLLRDWLQHAHHTPRISDNFQVITLIFQLYTFHLQILSAFVHLVCQRASDNHMTTLSNELLREAHKCSLYHDQQFTLQYADHTRGFFLPCLLMLSTRQTPYADWSHPLLCTLPKPQQHCMPFDQFMRVDPYNVAANLPFPGLQLARRRLHPYHIIAFIRLIRGNIGVFFEQGNSTTPTQPLVVQSYTPMISMLLFAEHLIGVYLYPIIQKTSYISICGAHLNHVEHHYHLRDHFYPHHIPQVNCSKGTPHHHRHHRHHADDFSYGKQNQDRCTTAVLDAIGTTPLARHSTVSPFPISIDEINNSDGEIGYNTLRHCTTETFYDVSLYNGAIAAIPLEDQGAAIHYINSFSGLYQDHGPLHNPTPVLAISPHVYNDGSIVTPSYVDLALEVQSLIQPQQIFQLPHDMMLSYLKSLNYSASSAFEFFYYLQCRGVGFELVASRISSHFSTIIDHYQHISKQYTFAHPFFSYILSMIFYTFDTVHHTPGHRCHEGILQIIIDSFSIFSYRQLTNLRESGHLPILVAAASLAFDVYISYTKAYLHSILNYFKPSWRHIHARSQHHSSHHHLEQAAATHDNVKPSLIPSTTNQPSPHGSFIDAISTKSIIQSSGQLPSSPRGAFSRAVSFDIDEYAHPPQKIHFELTHLICEHFPFDLISPFLSRVLGVITNEYAIDGVFELRLTYSERIMSKSDYPEQHIAWSRCARYFIQRVSTMPRSSAHFLSDLYQLFSYIVLQVDNNRNTYVHDKLRRSFPEVFQHEPTGSHQSQQQQQAPDGNASHHDTTGATTVHSHTISHLLDANQSIDPVQRTFYEHIYHDLSNDPFYKISFEYLFAQSRLDDPIYLHIFELAHHYNLISLSMPEGILLENLHPVTKYGIQAFQCILDHNHPYHMYISEARSHASSWLVSCLSYDRPFTLYILQLAELLQRVSYHRWRQQHAMMVPSGVFGYSTSSTAIVSAASTPRPFHHTLPALPRSSLNPSTSVMPSAQVDSRHGNVLDLDMFSPPSPTIHPHQGDTRTIASIQHTSNTTSSTIAALRSSVAAAPPPQSLPSGGAAPIPPHIRQPKAPVLPAIPPPMLTPAGSLSRASVNSVTRSVRDLDADVTDFQFNFSSSASSSASSSLSSDGPPRPLQLPHEPNDTTHQTMLAPSILHTKNTSPPPHTHGTGTYRRSSLYNYTSTVIVDQNHTTTLQHSTAHSALHKTGSYVHGQDDNANLFGGIHHAYQTSSHLANAHTNHTGGGTRHTGGHAHGNDHIHHSYSIPAPHSIMSPSLASYRPPPLSFPNYRLPVLPLQRYHYSPNPADSNDMSNCANLMAVFYEQPSTHITRTILQRIALVPSHHYTLLTSLMTFPDDPPMLNVIFRYTALSIKQLYKLLSLGIPLPDCSSITSPFVVYLAVALPNYFMFQKIYPVVQFYQSMTSTGFYTIHYNYPTVVMALACHPDQRVSLFLFGPEFNIYDPQELASLQNLTLAEVLDHRQRRLRHEQIPSPFSTLTWADIDTIPYVVPNVLLLEKNSGGTRPLHSMCPIYGSGVSQSGGSGIGMQGSYQFSSPYGVQHQQQQRGISTHHIGISPLTSPRTSFSSLQGHGMVNRQHLMTVNNDHHHAMTTDTKPLRDFIDHGHDDASIPSPTETYTPLPAPNPCGAITNPAIRGQTHMELKGILLYIIQTVSEPSIDDLMQLLTLTHEDEDQNERNAFTTINTYHHMHSHDETECEYEMAHSRCSSASSGRQYNPSMGSNNSGGSSSLWSLQTDSPSPINVNCTNDFGQTPLMLAILRRWSGTALLFLINKSGHHEVAHHRDIYGLTALDYADRCFLSDYSPEIYQILQDIHAQTYSPHNPTYTPHAAHD